ncbi:MAG: AAA family ATPase [Oscillibacter sp.]|nr:AAA family ATPase [Oscillibacter sp.]MEA4992923.1 AAA family ATPase [Oscillibacter sp.]
MPTVIESMTGISLSSPFFNKNPHLTLYPEHPEKQKKQDSPKKYRTALIYGPNGSGKSTIAQGFREYVESTSPRNVNLIPLAKENMIKISPDAKPEKFFVFDETYVEKNIKIQESGLDAIVLFGEQVELEQDIKDVNDLIMEKKEKLVDQEAECEKYSDPQNACSPQKWITDITKMLQSKNGWAETAGILIKGKKTSAKVNEEEIDRLGQLSPTGDETTNRAAFDKKYALFSNTSSDSQQFAFPIQTVNYMKNIEVEANHLFQKTISKPSLTLREEKLLGIFGVEVIAAANDYLAVNTNIICQTCLQPITDAYRAKTLKEIKTILNEEVDALQEELRSLIQKEIPIESYQQYRVLNINIYEKMRDTIETLNKAIAKHNKVIQAKINTLFEPMEYAVSIGLTAAYEAFNQELRALECERTLYNETIVKRKNVESELLYLNDVLAHYSTQSAYKSLLAQRSENAKDEKKRFDLNAEIGKLTLKLQDLDSKRGKIKIAADEINKELEYIFYCKGRLELVLGADKLYHLKAYGQSVTPNKISCGERNALALCYYFSKISNNMDARAPYSDETFLVIDDPVSSFDLGNRVGIISFLRLKLNQVLKSCPTTKVLIMTHDISVMFDLQKALQEISNLCEKKKANAEFVMFQLKEKVLKEFSYKSENEYTQLLREVYNFAKKPIDDLDLTIGNMMRRVLEAFSTFSFKMRIDEVSLNSTILNSLPDENSRRYFQNLMYRLVLNTESHFSETVRGSTETHFFSHLSTNEKQRTARDILCLVYNLNPTHILAHIPNAEKDLITWCYDIGIPKK